jgi:hypothetical protein
MDINVFINIFLWKKNLISSFAWVDAKEAKNIINICRFFYMKKNNKTEFFFCVTLSQY